MIRRLARSTLFPYTTLFRSADVLARPPMNPPGMAGAGTRLAVVQVGHGGLSGLAPVGGVQAGVRSEEHTSELQSLTNLVCRLLLEKKKPSGRRLTTAQARDL